MKTKLIRRIDFGWYQASDKVAGKLARATKLGRLPRIGHALDNVDLGDGVTATLQRTRVVGYTYAPKRGWVWAVYNISGENGRTVAILPNGMTFA